NAESRLDQRLRSQTEDQSQHSVAPANGVARSEHFTSAVGNADHVLSEQPLNSRRVASTQVQQKLRECASGCFLSSGRDRLRLVVAAHPAASSQKRDLRV